jgi:type I restriction enzyme S subunit
MSFPRYPKYKDSGVEWLGQVPEHWEVKRLKHNLHLLTEKTDRRENPVALENIESWTGRFIPTETEFEGEGIAFDAGDILFGKLRPYLAKALRAGSSGEAVGDFHVMRPVAGINSRFAQYQILNREFIAIVDGSTFGSKMPRASWEFVGGMKVTTPPQAEQKSIAAFLDQETAKIDELVAEQQRLMELLKEKRQAVISHAVTKGLNPKAALKPSGIEWLGDVPAHWEVTKIKRLASRISSGKTPLGGSEIYVDEGITFLRSQNIYDEGLRLDDVVFITEAVDEAMSVSRVKANDILLNITGASIGRSCVVPSELPSANVNQHVCVIRLENSSQVPFVGWLFKSATIKNQIDHAQNGAAREGLNFVQIGTMSVALPPAAEQESIASFLNLQTVQLDALNAEAQRAIDLLQERRTALISAAVTGQIDVRKT